MSNKIHILFPTEVEAAHFINPDTENIEVNICGVGLCEAGAFTAGIIAESKPRFMILAGIAGAYPNSGLTIGDVVVVGSETASDQGAFRDEKFTPLYSKTYLCDNAHKQTHFPVVDGSSVNAAAAEFFDNANRKVESMEGAAFFAVASKLGTPFMEIRAVSNMTTSSRQEWRMEDATKAVAKALYRILYDLDA